MWRKNKKWKEDEKKETSYKVQPLKELFRKMQKLYRNTFFFCFSFFFLFLFLFIYLFFFFCYRKLTRNTMFAFYTTTNQKLPVNVIDALLLQL